MLNYVRQSNRMLNTTYRDNWITPEPFDIPHYKQGAQAPESIPNPWPMAPLLERYQTLFEEYTPNSDGDRTTWKDFQHYYAKRLPATGRFDCKSSFEWDLYPNHHTGTGNHPRIGTTGLRYWAFGAPPILHRPFGEPGLPLQGLPGLYSKQADGSFVPPPANLDDLEKWAMKSMLPSIKAGMSLINTLLELKDFKSLPRSLDRIADNIEGTLQRFRHYGGKQSIRRLLRGTSEGYLQAQFNILPLLSDISGVQAALTRLERRLNDLITREGRVQKRHYTFAWIEHPSTSELYEDWYQILPNAAGLGPYSQYRLRRKTSEVSAIFHAMIEYNYNFTQYQREHARLNGILDSLGVNLSPSIIWNAIPWSFVIDWFVNVSSFVKQFDSQNMEPKINIRRYLWSVRRERNIFTTRLGKEDFTTRGVIAFPTWSQEVPLPTTVEVAYRRQVGMPSASSLSVSGVSPKEITLGAALVLARRRRRSHRGYTSTTAGAR